MKKSAFFIKTIISFGFLSLLLSDALASGTPSNHITLYTHALELKPIPSSFQLAKSTFLPDRFDDLGLSNYNTLDNNYNSVNCDTYPLTSCPAGSRCETCPFDAKKFRVLSCNDPYILSGGTCVCPTKVTLSYANDRCTKYCGSTCIAKTCSPSANQSGCTNGTQSCDNGCGANTRQCCVACAHKVTSKPSYASYTYSSCYDGSTKEIQTGWKCNSGYHQKDSTCEKDCITNNCSGYSLTSCPANAICTPCTITATNCTTSGTKYKIDSCADGYYQSGNSCIKNCTNTCAGYSFDSCPEGSNCSLCTLKNATCVSYGIKYKVDSCYSGYTLANNSCYVSRLCRYAGDIMYSDKTCSGYNDAINPSKKIIAIVVNSCVDNYQCFAMAITPVQVAWSTQPFDIPSIQQNSDNGKENTKEILNYCSTNGYSCPAAEYAYNYQTEGTIAGEWFLPSSEEGKKIKINIDDIQNSMIKVGSYLYTEFWTSNEESSVPAYKAESIFTYYQTVNFPFIYNHYKTDAIWVYPFLQYSYE